MGITQYEASYPALTRFLPALQVADGGRCDNTSSVGVIAREYLFCSRERWSLGWHKICMYMWHTSQKQIAMLSKYPEYLS